jgi:hypothetical protein
VACATKHEGANVLERAKPMKTDRIIERILSVRRLETPHLILRLGWNMDRTIEVGWKLGSSLTSLPRAFRHAGSSESRSAGLGGFQTGFSVSSPRRRLTGDNVCSLTNLATVVGPKPSSLAIFRIDAPFHRWPRTSPSCDDHPPCVVVRRLVIGLLPGHSALAQSDSFLRGNGCQDPDHCLFEDACGVKVLLGI